MIKIKDKSKVPHGLYNFKVQETGREFEAHVFGRLVLKVQEYQGANNLKVWTSREIEEDYCKRYPLICVDTEAMPPVPQQQVHDDMLTRIAASVGIPAADALAKLSAKLGIKCQSCARRHKIISRLREIGWDEALRQLKETL